MGWGVGWGLRGGGQLGFVVCNHYYALPVRVNLHAIAMKILHRPLDLVAVEEARSHVAPRPPSSPPLGQEACRAQGLKLPAINNVNLGQLANPRHYPICSVVRLPAKHLTLL